MVFNLSLGELLSTSVLVHPPETDETRKQHRLFAQVMPVLLPEAQKVPTKDRKLVVVGLTNLLTRSTKMLNEPHVRIW